MVLISVFVGLLQGLLAFLPVSGSGHFLFIYAAFGVESPALTAILSCAHLGTMVAVVVLFQKDFLRLAGEMIKLPGELRNSFSTYVGRIKKGVQGKPAPVFTGNYGKLLMLCLVGNIPTCIIGLCLYNMVNELADNTLAAGIGFLFTSLFLLAASLMPLQNKGPQELKIWQVIVTGLCQGLAVIPGVSRFALTLSVLLLFGQSKKSAVKCSVIMQLPAVIGAFVVSAYHVLTYDFSAIRFAAAILCIVVSGFVGCLMIRPCLNYVQKHKLYVFSGYTFFAALICIGCHMIFAG